LKRNGHGQVQVKTLHGQFEFRLQKYLQDGQSVSYFDLTEQLTDGYVSPRLQELSAYYSNRMSYEDVAGLVERITGERLLSDQSIWQIVQRQAVQVSKQWKSEVETSLSAVVGLPEVNGQVDVYDRLGAEILLFEDGIQVKQQKEKRVGRSEAKSGLEGIVNEFSKRSRVNTDVFLLQKSNGAFEYLSAGIDRAGNESVSLARMVQARMVQEYGKKQEPLNLVAITDGNQEKLAELMGYLEKHRTEIIDYERRQQTGKSIGSGRVEKGVDQVIGHRQKGKGTSWRPKGSKALAILKILELNGRWQQTWFSTQATS
jgi:hypothetical protein